MKWALLFFLLAFFQLFGCKKSSEDIGFWPKAQSIYSERGDEFQVERVSNDTILFNMKGKSEYVSFFWDSGKMVKRNDTVLFKLTNGMKFTPIFVLDMPLGDSIISNQAVRVDVGAAIGIQDNKLIYPDTIEFIFKKIVEKKTDTKIYYIFEGKSPLMHADKCQFIITPEQGIVGIWFIDCNFSFSDEFYTPSVGLGWYPSTNPYILIPRKFN